MKQIRNISRKGLAAFLAVWLSGIVFVFCCDMSAEAATTDSCPLAKAASNHCDKSKNKKNFQLVSTDRTCSLSGCALIPAVFDKTRKVELEVHAVQPVDQPAVSPRTFKLISRSHDNPALYTSLHLVQDKIFIKHRVFRI